MDRILEGHAEDNVFLPSLEVLATEKDTRKLKKKKRKKIFSSFNMYTSVTLYKKKKTYSSKFKNYNGVQIVCKK